jgi:hypothetical protein
MFDNICYGTHFCRYALIIFFKLALYVTTTIKILCMHTIMHEFFYINEHNLFIFTHLTKSLSRVILPIQLFCLMVLHVSDLKWVTWLMTSPYKYG